MKVKTQMLFLLISFLSVQGYSQLLKQKPDYGLSLGTSFTTSGYGSGIISYVSPHLGYSISPRFKINTGISIMNTNLIGYKPFYNTEQKFNGNFTSALVYLNGQYLVNKKLTLNGTVYKQFSLLNDPANPYSNTGNFEGFNVGFSYKPAENFQIDAGFGYSNGYNPYQQDIFRTNPFGHSYFPW